MPLRRDEPPHPRDELWGEHRILLALIHPVRQLLSARYIRKPDLLQFVDEDPLRQRPGDSARPGCGIGEDLRRQVIVHDDVGDHDPTAEP